MSCHAASAAAEHLQAKLALRSNLFPHSGERRVELGQLPFEKRYAALRAQLPDAEVVDDRGTNKPAKQRTQER